MKNIYLDENAKKYAPLCRRFESEGALAHESSISGENSLKMLYGVRCSIFTGKDEIVNIKSGGIKGIITEEITFNTNPKLCTWGYVEAKK